MQSSHADTRKANACCMFAMSTEKCAKCQMERVDEKCSLLAVAKQWWKCCSQARSKRNVMSTVLV